MLKLHPRTCVFYLRLARWALFSGGTTAHRRLGVSLLQSASSMGAFRSYFSEVPLASVQDVQPVMTEVRDWRRHFAACLVGTGIELGALHRPIPVGKGSRVLYADRLSHDELRREYPELSSETMVVPDILTDAETLANVDAASMDFLIAAHVIEHMRNPIGALRAWARVVRPGGLLYLIVPDKRATFDAHRTRTSLEHLILDADRPSEERDFEHYLDWAVHVLWKKGREALHEAEGLWRARHSIHFHVFQPDDVVALVTWVGEAVAPLSIVEGPARSPDDDEFHVLLRVGGGREPQS